MIHEAGKKMHELFLTTGTRNGIGLNFCVYQEKVMFLESTPLLEWERRCFLFKDGGLKLKI